MILGLISCVGSNRVIPNSKFSCKNSFKITGRHLAVLSDCKKSSDREK